MHFNNLHTEGSLRKRKSRPQASLTATHSSTLAEEIVSVLRILHSLVQWNSLINDYINAQLSSIGDVMAGCQSEAVRSVYCWQWNVKRNVLTKLWCEKNPILLFQCLLEEYFPDSEGFQVGSVMAVLAVIGGIDGRLRLGGQVIHDEYGEGTVTRITPKGRITVQFHEMRTCRVCLLSHLKSVCFHTLPLKQTQLQITEVINLWLLRLHTYKCVHRL